ncbi:MAG: YceD family protein [Gallionella sp.]|nr:YceD family protein [Gallionella sp.]
MFARPLIDAMEFAGNGRELRGEVPVEALPRLGDMLVDSQGTVTYVVRGFRTDDSNILEVSLSGVCHLRCQRCLGELEYQIKVTSRLKLASTEELAAVDEDDEDEYIEAASQLDVIELVEDELLLSLPFAPKHPDGTCVSANEGLKQAANPFSVLAGLKKK